MHTVWDRHLQWTTSSSFYFHKTGTEPLQGTESSKFQLTSLLLQVSSRHQIIFFLHKCHQGHHKALKHLLSTCFSTFPSFIKAISNHLIFYSLFYFYESCQLRLFFTPQPWAVWLKSNTQSSVMFSSSFAGLLRSLRLSLCTDFSDFLSFSICPYYQSLPAGLSNVILSLDRADVNKFLFISQHWCILGKHPLWVHYCFSSSVPYVLFVLLQCFLRWEVSGSIYLVWSSIICKTTSNIKELGLTTGFLTF